jgi:hypothetical protein
VTITGPVFVITVLIFSVVEVVADPLMTKIAIGSVPALRGGRAGDHLRRLPITTWISSGLQINGVKIWLLATLVVWLAALLADLILLVLLVKKVVDRKRS